jgi:hypothetical protein
VVRFAVPWLALLGAVLCVACQPNLDDTVSVVTSPRVLAIQAVPAEAPPSATVKFTALVAPAAAADAGGPRLQWNYCNARNPLSNLGPVNTACVVPGNAALQPIGTGLAASGSVPGLACSNFGPNAPAGMDGGAGGQPVNPDSTGGYYQPVSAFLKMPSPYDTIYFMRLSCGFAGANEASQGILAARYHLNTNPEVASLMGNGKALVAAVGGAKNSVPGGSKLALEVVWPVCPLVDKCGDGVCGADESAMSCPSDCAPPVGGKVGGPKGCAGAERYVNFDLSTQTVVDQREGIDVSWFATAGTFTQDRTGRAGTDDATTSDDQWTAPTSLGDASLWVVLRDDRGGVSWAEYAFDVK